MPRVGNPESIAHFASTERSTAVRTRLLTVIQIVLYGQLFLLGAVVWLRNRKTEAPLLDVGVSALCCVLDFSGSSAVSVDTGQPIRFIHHGR